MTVLEDGGGDVVGVIIVILSLASSLMFVCWLVA